MATIRDLPVLRESLSAASLASAPELQKKTRAVGSCVREINFCASSNPAGWLYKLLT